MPHRTKAVLRLTLRTGRCYRTALLIFVMVIFNAPPKSDFQHDSSCPKSAKSEPQSLVTDGHADSCRSSFCG